MQKTLIALAACCAAACLGLGIMLAQAGPAPGGEAETCALRCARAAGAATASSDAPAAHRCTATCAHAGAGKDDRGTAHAGDSPRCTPSRCADFGACSLYGNLAFATGDLLARYERQKGEDGRRFQDLDLPPFRALDVDGSPVSSADLAGRPAVIALLASHCTHSHDSIPILNDLVRRAPVQGLQVVGVVVNSGSPRDVREWMPGYDPAFRTWIVEDDAVAHALDSHLVPTWLYVDAGGRLLGKRVGFKSGEEIRRWVAELAGASAA